MVWLPRLRSLSSASAFHRIYNTATCLLAEMRRQKRPRSTQLSGPAYINTSGIQRSTGWDLTAKDKCQFPASLQSAPGFTIVGVMFFQQSLQKQLMVHVNNFISKREKSPQHPWMRRRLDFIVGYTGLMDCTVLSSYQAATPLHR